MFPNLLLFRRRKEKRHASRTPRRRATRRLRSSSHSPPFSFVCFRAERIWSAKSIDSDKTENTYDAHRINADQYEVTVDFIYWTTYFSSRITSFLWGTSSSFRNFCSFFFIIYCAKYQHFYNFSVSFPWKLTFIYKICKSLYTTFLLRYANPMSGERCPGRREGPEDRSGNRTARSRLCTQPWREQEEHMRGE